MTARIVKKIVLIIILIGLIVGSIYYGANFYFDSLLAKAEQGEKIDINEANINDMAKNEEDAHEVVNIMLLGVDNSDKGSRSDSYNEERSDAIKVISLDYTAKKIKITSLQRDVVVYLPGDYQQYAHLNWASWYGGSKLSVQTVNYNLDLDITSYVAVSFAGFIDIVDEIGGIDIELSQKEADAFNGQRRTNARMNITAVKGNNHLDGYNALAYARLRYTDSDFVRVNRQNLLIKKLAAKLKKMKITDLLLLADKIMPYVSTDLSADQIKKYINDLLSFDLDDILSYTWPSGEYDDICNCPGLGGYLLNSYSRQVEELHKFIYDIDAYQPSETVRENEKRTYEKYGEFSK